MRGAFGASFIVGGLCFDSGEVEGSVVSDVDADVVVEGLVDCRRRDWRVVCE